MLMNAAVYVILLIGGGAAAYYFNDRLGYTPLLFLVFLAFFDMILTVIARLSIKTCKVPDACELTRGNEAKIVFVFANRGPLIISHVKAWMRLSGENLERSYGCSCNFAILPHNTVNVDFFVILPHLGLADAQITKIKVYGLLGLFWFSYKPSARQPIWVLPKTNGEADGNAADKGNLIENQSKSITAKEMQNPDYYNGAREYEPGDSLHDIHWKLTAHSGKCMTRLYESEDSGGLTIMVDLRPAPYRRALNLCVNDKLIETAVSMASEVVLHGGRAKCVFSDGSLFQTLRIESEADISEISARLVTAKPPPNSIPDIDAKVCGKGAIVYFTANADIGAAKRLSEIKNTGGQSELVFVVPDGFYTEKNRGFLNFLERHNVDYTVFESELNI